MRRSSKLINSMGEKNALTMAAAALRGMGSTSRAALTELHIPLAKWRSLRHKPDQETLDAVVKIVEPLDDSKHANLVFGTYGEFSDGTGAAWVYIEAIEEAIKGTNNRFTRAMQLTIDKARTGIGKPRREIDDKEKAEAVKEFASKYINTVIKGD